MYHKPTRIADRYSLQQVAHEYGVSINDVVDDQRIDALTGTAVLNGTPVEVEPVRLASTA
jgi:hypothetical protein